MKDKSKTSLLAPLGIPAFRAIWSANLVSNLGTLVQSVAAAWLMTGLTTSTTLVGLVQTAATLPVFLVGLPAGALADIVDRKHLLFWSQTWMLAMAALLSGLAFLGHITPHSLLALTFAIGLGAAISLPAWQATVQDLVPKPWVPAAVSLNAISFNVARAFGPALGGLLVATAGAAFAFLANAASFVAVLLAVSLWKPEPAPPRKHTEDIASAIRAGLRYLLHAPRLQAPIARAAIYNLCAGSVWALLPLFARDVVRTNATGYGLLLGAFGLGSILSALTAPHLRSRFQLDRILLSGGLLCATAYAGLAFTKDIRLAALLLFLAGGAWVGVFINFNVAVQTAVPAWVRGRALSFYLLTFQGTLALDGALWGWLAGRVGTAECFALAAGGLVLGLLGIRFFPLTSHDAVDLNRPVDWPYAHDHVTSDPDDGPVLVTVEFFIAPENAGTFRTLMRQLREQRLRDGARRWRLYHDMENPDRFVELFRLDSWADHLLQVDRFTMDDLQLRATIFALHQGPEKPKARHYLGLED